MNMYTSLCTNICRSLLAALFVSATVTANFSLPVSADTGPAAAKITFTFDDARQSQYTTAAPVLAKYGFSGTDFVTTGCVGMTTTPNTCHAANDVKYMTWTQIKALQNAYGWEIGSHSVTHPYLATFDAQDGQPKALTQAEVIKEVADSKTAFKAQGIDAKAFATPYGDYNTFTLQTIAKYYASHRGFADQNDNVWPYNDMVVQDMEVQQPVTLAAVKAKVDYAISKKQWLVLTFHDIVTTPSSDINKYQWSTSNLDAVAAYVKTKVNAGLIKPVNASNGPATSTVNLLPNSGFANGISSWRTDNAAAFVADSGNNGSYPEPLHSLAIKSSTTSAHLFSPTIAVDSSTVYVLKSFLNVKAIKAGEIGFYIDEYDSNGKWVSGQYKTRENSVYVESMNFSYKPSSIQVKSASLQIYTTAASGITAYLDSLQWFPVTTVAAQINLMPNSGFDSGINSGWRTDNIVSIKTDNANHGAPANPIYSVAVAKSAGTSHLFSPQIAVTSTKSYYLENYLNILTNTSGEVGFYIDEYDTNGNWVSGQYKTTVITLGAKDISFTYTPSSSIVAKASLQVIFNSNNSLSAYFDHSRFWAL